MFYIIFSVQGADFRLDFLSFFLSFSPKTQRGLWESRAADLNLPYLVPRAPSSISPPRYYNKMVLTCKVTEFSATIYSITRTYIGLQYSPAASS